MPVVFLEDAKEIERAAVPDVAVPLEPRLVRAGREGGGAEPEVDLVHGRQVGRGRRLVLRRRAGRQQQQDGEYLGESGAHDVLLPLPKEEVSRGVIRAVDLRVAVDAGPADDPVAAGVQLRGVVDRRGMAAADVAALTQHRRLGDEQAVVVRTVRIVAAGAVFTPRRVLPDERSPLLGVAAGARLVDRVADAQQPNVGRAVRRVARGALHLRFAYWH